MSGVARANLLTAVVVQEQERRLQWVLVQETIQGGRNESIRDGNHDQPETSGGGGRLVVE